MIGIKRLIIEPFSETLVDFERYQCTIERYQCTIVFENLTETGIGDTAKNALLDAYHNLKSKCYEIEQTLIDMNVITKEKE